MTTVLVGAAAGINAMTKSHLGEERVYFDLHFHRPQYIIEGSQGRRASGQGSGAETMEEAAHWLAHWLMFSQLS